ncbi:MetQ/NlpA family ABC transporter substrate-binding protein [Caldibacillus lycopersici]|uniref:Lipoprotein n=1 Tax=Perspicuibacillus lycopersici TaxID=1325689 RepID=A0AAE3ISW4_9BACI|nr:MetQ/NlpA family ABC transporter substrate-binding protein [Perspicuibacillus lycopersici]MCU9612844.1 MetQ/NlpA family ABC transporter substrate-binding protein [Perspicuibacillus lycopersici]
MKKLTFLLAVLILSFTLAACNKDDSKTLVIGATDEPHAVILEKAKPILEEQGIDLEVKTFSKYELLNPALDSKDLDANYFQHIPYLEAENANGDYDNELVNAGGIHIEPIGIYSKKYSSLEELPDGATILMSSNTPDHGRILTLFEAKGLITLKEGIDKTTATLDDIAENPKNLTFEYDYAPELLPEIYDQGEGDAVVINSNYALSAGLNPKEDSIAIEDSESPYVNVIAVRKGDEDREEIKALINVLHSEEIQQFILDEWGGSVVPVNE